MRFRTNSEFCSSMLFCFLSFFPLLSDSYIKWTDLKYRAQWNFTHLCPYVAIIQIQDIELFVSQNHLFLRRHSSRLSVRRNSLAKWSLLILECERREQRNQKLAGPVWVEKVFFFLKYMGGFKEKLKQPVQTIVLISGPRSVVPNMTCDIILSGQMAF